MLAVPVAELPAPHSCAGGSCRYESKVDGWRVALFRIGDQVLLQSRHGRRIGGWFPDLCRAAAVLPDGLVLDGELVAWDGARQRTDFGALQRRIVAGRGLSALAVRSPAYLVAFDVLAWRGEDVRSRPLRTRRQLLEELLAGEPDRIVLCPQTGDVDEARRWLTETLAIGAEGLVVKAPGSQYRGGRNKAWRKLRVRRSAEAVVGGVTGTRARPAALLLGRYDVEGRFRLVGGTGQLTARQAAELAPLLSAPGMGRQRSTHPWPNPLPAGWLGRWREFEDVVVYQQVEPDVVVEVSADTAQDAGRWRHPVRYIRPRLDLSPYEPVFRWDEPG
jgi:ATP-dependent DNA ligase